MTLDLARLRQREPDAIEEAVRAHSGDLLHAAMGLGFAVDAAEELVQRVWATFVQAVVKFEGRSSVRTFLFGILYNKALELRREQARFDTSDPIEEVIERRFHSDGHWKDPPKDPERMLLAMETTDIVQGCLDALPVKQRMAFFLKHVREEATEEVCNVLGVSVTNLGVLLFRARHRLRECVEKKVGRDG